MAAELDELAQKIGDRELRTNALWVRYIASLTRGNSLEVRRQNDLLNQLAEELHQGSQLWYACVMATVVALQDGRFDEAETLLEQGRWSLVGRPRDGTLTPHQHFASPKCW